MYYSHHIFIHALYLLHYTMGYIVTYYKYQKQGILWHVVKGLF